jgi:uncharacterized protein (TIGR00288 family)
MTERVLNILRRQGKSISCIFDGKLIDAISSSQLNEIIEQIRQIGSIRKFITVFDHQLKSEDFDFLIHQGISPMIVSSDYDIYLALETLDVINSKQMDILCLGIIEDSLLPVIVTARESFEILLVTLSVESIKKCHSYADYLISIEK